MHKLLYKTHNNVPLFAPPRTPLSMFVSSLKSQSIVNPITVIKSAHPEKALLAGRESEGGRDIEGERYDCNDRKIWMEGDFREKEG